MGTKIIFWNHFKPLTASDELTRPKTVVACSGCRAEQVKSSPCFLKEEICNKMTVYDTFLLGQANYHQEWRFKVKTYVGVVFFKKALELKG